MERAMSTSVFFINTSVFTSLTRGVLCSSMGVWLMSLPHWSESECIRYPWRRAYVLLERFIVSVVPHV